MHSKFFPTLVTSESLTLSDHKHNAPDVPSGISSQRQRQHIANWRSIFIV